MLYHNIRISISGHVLHSKGETVKRLVILLLPALLLPLSVAQAEEEEPGWVSGQAGDGESAPRQQEGPQAAILDRGRLTAGTDFNPAISLILDGVYRNDFSGEVGDPPGFGGGHDHDHGHGHDHAHGIEEGMQLREAELTLTGTVDPYFDAVGVIGIHEGGGVDLEEAYIQTRALPGGLQLKAGKFLSDIGYINRQHIHDWDFVDQPLVMREIFGDHGLQDTGVQMTWLAPLPFYNQYGIEVLQGSNDGVARYSGSGSHTIAGYDTDEDPSDARERSQIDYGLDDHSGPRLVTAFSRFAPDLGFNHAARFGVSGGYASSWQDADEHGSGRVDVWDGDAWFAGLDAVYKYDSGRAYGHGNWTVQAEYFYRELDLDYENRVPDEWSNDAHAGFNIEDEWSQKARQDGFYLQALYGFAPRWNAGLRAEAVGLTNESAEPDRDAGAFEEFDTTYRYSAQVRFMPTEFSILRAQLNYKDLPDHDGHDHDSWSFMLQYNISLGEHGAHEF